MVSSFDKAIIALLGSIVTIAAAFGLELSWATPELIGTIGSVLTGILTYLIPNKAKA
jgi:membrane protein YqaA with SNARE-associated domain